MRDWGFRAILSGVLGLSLLASACGSSGGGSPSAGSSGKPIASQMILGGPPECPTRPFCEKGLMDKYGLTFKDFKTPLVVGLAGSVVLAVAADLLLAGAQRLATPWRSSR